MHRIDAEVEGVHAGYIKVSYIPSANAAKCTDAWFKYGLIDQPCVSYILVFRGLDEFGFQEGPTEIDWRRLGIGTALYQAAALWMAERGLTLRASTTQSGAAKAAWKRMAESGEFPIVRNVRVGDDLVYALDYRKQMVA